MKILIVAGYFPPYSPNSAIRVNKLSKYLLARGHDVKVLAPRNQAYPPILEPEIDDKHIIYTDYDDINQFPERVINGIKRILKGASATENQNDDLAGTTGQGNPGNASSAAMPGADEDNWSPSFISRVYMALTNVPDNIVGWYPHAIRAARRLRAAWQPDIIFATAPPHTTLLVASKISRVMKAPWVCEYRDLWSDHPYYSEGKCREVVDRFLEGRILRNCAGLVTVTQTWADLLREKRQLPVEFVMNGFDPDDFQEGPFRPLNDDVITITYAGVLYEGKRDPSALFAALGQMGEKARNFVVRFHVPNPDTVIQMASKYKVEHCVDARPLVPFSEALEIMKRSDLLMLLRWDHPGENGVIAGKLFEYIGACRPILSIGSTEGEAADIIRDQHFGVVSNNADDIVRYLEDCLVQKQSGQIAAPPAAARHQYSRNTQFERLEAFMQGLIT
ncbi:MAG: hypothetical protein CMF31_10885 [Kordiimonas sp.]|nr:hypothetical protein [Kordiimonas sp.]